VALLLPIAVSAQTFVQKPSVANNLSLTLTPSAPARLKYVSSQLTVEAQAEVAQATYTVAGLIVEMSVGTITQTGTEPFQPKGSAVSFQIKGSATFKTVRLTFASNGDLTDIRFD
jgi:hypothetical protein